MTKHLANLNLFREEDGSLWITVASAQGVKEELGMADNLPVYSMTIQTVFEAVKQMQKRIEESNS